jgi:hypothetical protein
MSGKSEATRRNEAKLTLAEAHRLFKYDPETGILTRRISPSKNVKAGDVAGTISGGGHLQLKVNHVSYGVHRICWFMTYGRWPHYQLDHINGVRTDNRMSNLREVSSAENCRNRSIQADNKSGVTGVSWHKKYGRWSAYIGHNGKLIYLGMFDRFEDAVAARKAAEVLYGYHQNHGLTAEARSRSHSLTQPRPEVPLEDLHQANRSDYAGTQEPLG